MSAPQYPKRGSHFAHKVVRMMLKTCAAQDIGHLAALLVAAVAHTEDAKHYAAPVSYYNDQIMQILGIKKWESLDRARRAAVDAGWLHYECRGKRQSGIYWVTIPKHLQRIPDGPIDESLSPINGYSEGDKQGDKPQSIYPSNGYKPGDNEGDKQGDNGGDPPIDTKVSIPSPVPNPVPTSPVGDQTDQPKEAEPEETPAGETESAFLNAWNDTPGNRKALAWNKERRKRLRTRLKDPVWVESWTKALAKFPLKCFSSEPDGWQPDIDWFLRPDTVTAILEGKYDWIKPNGKSTTPHIGPGQRYSPTASGAGFGKF